ncbi:MAG: hypothetical protein Q9166_001292 [cf. Caloplaca sp. 2 TL-2023]
MAVPSTLNQRVKATKAISDDEESASLPSGTDSHQSPFVDEEISSDNDEVHSKATSSGEELAAISFGLLAKAQESLCKRNHGHGGTHVRPMSIDRSQEFDNAEALERKAGKKDHRELVRSSKHAPAEMSSKKAVSRKREVVPTMKRDIRDPRFEPVTGPLDEQKAKKNYNFLNEYRDSEMTDLKTQIRQNKDTSAKEKLKRSLLSMESRKKAQQMKDQEQEIRRAHRAKEKKMVKQGKRPFFLKKGEQKKLALLQRFQGIKGKRLDKVIERRRKKNTQKERRDMPQERRVVNG